MDAEKNIETLEEKERKKQNSLNNLKMFEPGKSGNPAGKKKGVRAWHVVMRELFEQGDYSQDDLVRVYIEQAQDGNLKAIEWLAERMDGKAKQELIVTDTELTKKKLKEMFEAAKK